MDPNSSPRHPSPSAAPMRWGSPALTPGATFPPASRMPAGSRTPPVQNLHGSGYRGSRSFGGPGSGSPQFIPCGQMGPSFRTPQPQNRHRSPSLHQPPWTEGKGRGRSKQFFGKSPGSSPRSDSMSNPGGSDDITQYYSPSMLQDPWQNTPPLPVNHWLRQT